MKGLSIQGVSLFQDRYINAMLFHHHEVQW